MCSMDAAKGAPKIGKIIKRARERKRMSQAEAAAALGVSRSALNAWENDRAYPRSSIGAIEELYGISLDEEPESTDVLEERWGREDAEVVRRVLGTYAPDQAEAMLREMQKTFRPRPAPPGGAAADPSRPDRAAS